MDDRPRVRRLIGAAVVVALGATMMQSAVAQDSVDNLREAREDARRDAAEAAAAIDALAAEDAELVEALAVIDDLIALQEDKVRAATVAIRAAEDAAAVADERADQLDDQIAAIRIRLRERAVEAYIGSEAAARDELDTANLLESTIRRSLIDQIIGDEYELVDQLRTAVAEQEAAEAEAQAALDAAEAERRDLNDRLADLEVTLKEAEELRAEVRGRVAQWQTISDEIEAADQEIADEIRRLEEQARRAAEEQARQEAEARRVAEEEARRAAEDAAAAETEDEADDEPDDDLPTGDFSISHRPVSGIITSPFGERVHPIFGTVRNHYGTDFNGSTGDPIVAASGGVVLSSGWRTGYGNTVVVSHGEGFTTLYAHMSDMNVSAGDQVAGGDLIGWVGNTGWSTGSHLHFEVRLDGVALDPALHL
ncbi:MAG: peptidoglycan DD-metalloendopeptidase family protein [Acidimicrobiales bacterium]|nr:peptidoglycan DD-metalloendopeptidase family protein [Acidimicrobiales bacterium]